MNAIKTLQRQTDEEGEEEEEVLARADPSKVEALTSLAEADELAGEQTWPTREEEAEAVAAAMAMEGEGEGEEDAGDGGKRKKEQSKERLLKKMSAYQAAWFEGEEGVELDDEDEEDDEDDDASLLMAEMSAGGGKDGKGDEGSGMDVAIQKKKQQLALEEEELEFPDEVQTPDDTPARERFARYRALKSFRTSPWDPYESLPRCVRAFVCSCGCGWGCARMGASLLCSALLCFCVLTCTYIQNDDDDDIDTTHTCREYARIFKFQNFQASHARVLSEMEEVERAQNQVRVFVYINVCMLVGARRDLPCHAHSIRIFVDVSKPHQNPRADCPERLHVRRLEQQQQRRGGHGHGD